MRLHKMVKRKGAGRVSADAETWVRRIVKAAEQNMRADSGRPRVILNDGDMLFGVLAALPREHHKDATRFIMGFLRDKAQSSGFAIDLS